jgi:hypothetical protein
MTRWHPLEPVDARFFVSAPHIFRHERRFAATPARVWESITSDASAAAWGRMINKVTWTSPPPHGVGATRESVALGAHARSRYFRWDESSGYSMFVYESTASVFTRYAEDFILRPDEGGTLFTFTVAIEPKAVLALPFKAFAPVLRAYLGRIASDGERYFANTV